MSQLHTRTQVHLSKYVCAGLHIELRKILRHESGKHVDKNSLLLGRRKGKGQGQQTQSSSHPPHRAILYEKCSSRDQLLHPDIFGLDDIRGKGVILTGESHTCTIS